MKCANGMEYFTEIVHSDSRPNDKEELFRIHVANNKVITMLDKERWGDRPKYVLSKNNLHLDQFGPW